jgi:hypothetical protein
MIPTVCLNRKQSRLPHWARRWTNTIRLARGLERAPDGAFSLFRTDEPQLESAYSGLPAASLMLAVHIFSIVATTGVGIGTKSRSSAILPPFE